MHTKPGFLRFAKLLDAVKRNWGLSNTGGRQGCLSWLIVVIDAPRDITLPLDFQTRARARASTHLETIANNCPPTIVLKERTASYNKMAPAQPELKKVRYLSFISWARLYTFCSCKLASQYPQPSYLLIGNPG